MKKILLISNGGREHAIADAIKRSKSNPILYTFATANNPGIYNLSEEYFVANSLKNFDDLKNFVEKIKPDFAIIGPDDPLADGIVDFLETLGVTCVGPHKINAQLESSKAFTRNLIEKYKINANPQYKNFTSKEGIQEFMKKLEGQFVVKYDSLKGGKGVKVIGDHLKSIEDGYEYACECIEECGKVVIEEKLIGEEFSLISFVDGENVIDTPAIQDHKRAYEGDIGPNTGGMGTYSDEKNSLPFLTMQNLKDAHEINVQVAKAIKEETGIAYKGFLYGGFIITKNGVKLIEYNARLGDPEAMNILSILKTDFVEICEAIINSNLNTINVEFEKKATVCKYLVPEGYPDSPIKNQKIQIDYTKIPKNAKLYFASVDGTANDLILCGSRTIAIVGIGENLEEAEKTCEEAIKQIKGPMFHRKDIGTQALIQKRIDHLEEISSI